MALNSFFYDGQIRRFLIQFVRILSHFQVEFGKDRNGNVALQQVPVFYGDSSRQAATILTGNSENAMPSVPCIAVYISAFDYDRPRVQEPYHVSKLQMRERSYDAVTDTWGHNQGDAFTVERLMPVPYKLTLKADIWTSNTEQKLQLIEQITPLFNPAFEIQSTDNYIDWTSLSAVYLTGTTWSSRQVPTGTSNQIDIATLTFELPIWLSLPVKVKKMGVIKKIITSMYDPNGDLSADITNSDLLAKQVLTPLNYGLVFYGNTLELIRFQDNRVTDTLDGPVVDSGAEHPWKDLIDVYGGTITNGLTEVRLEQPSGNVVVGTVSQHPTEPTLLLFSPYADTIPTNTVPPITAIIDPFKMPVDPTYFINGASNANGDSGMSPVGQVTTGTRYLILHAIGAAENIDPAIAWKGIDNSNLIAEANDIIEFNGTHWFVSFNASGQTEVKYVTNMKSGLQFKWDPETQSWSKSIEGKYDPGSWTIVLTA
jgi:hypothetical protein